MGVYIKGMKMPKDCTECKLFGYYGCPFVVPVGYIHTQHERNEDCPFVFAPSHGRLIDADKLCELCGIMADNSDDIFKSIWNQFKTTVEWCPTIIPAEEE